MVEHTTIRTSLKIKRKLEAFVRKICAKSLAKAIKKIKSLRECI